MIELLILLRRRDSIAPRGYVPQWAEGPHYPSAAWPIYESDLTHKREDARRYNAFVAISLAQRLNGLGWEALLEIA